MSVTRNRFVIVRGLTSHQTHCRVGTGFYGSNDSTNSVRALKEDRVLTMRLQSHEVREL